MKIKYDTIKTLDDLELVDGIKCCLQNSNELHKSALILKENNIFGVSISLLVLSIEELMKSFALFQIFISKGEHIEIYRDIFESKSNSLHKNRSEFAIFFNDFFKKIDFKAIFENANTLSEEQIFDFWDQIKEDELFEKIEKMKTTNWFSNANEMKNKGIYVGYNKKWLSPNTLKKKDFDKAFKETKTIRDILNVILSTFNEFELSELKNDIEEIRKLSAQLK